MADLLDLAKLCNVLPGRIDREANSVAVSITRSMAAELIEVTPVDTSQALSNWQGSNNQPPSFGLPAIFEGDRGSTMEASQTEAKAHVERALSDKLPGDPFYLSNLTPYIEDLNNGTSKQEPAGFVERALARAGVLLSQLKMDISK